MFLTLHFWQKWPISLQTALQVHWTTVDISIMHMGFYAGIFVCTFVAQNYALRFGPKAVITAGLVGKNHFN